MKRFSEWLKITNLTDLANLITQGLWIWGSLRFTDVASRLMLSESTHAESHHGIGFNLAIALLTAWTGKSGIGALSHWGNRTSSREYMDKKKDIEAAKATRPPPMVEAPGGDVSLTGERPAIVPAERPAAPSAPPPLRTRAPSNVTGWMREQAEPVAPPHRGSVRPDEPSVWTDDERGDPDPDLPVHLVGLGEPHNYNRLREPRLGVMLHYDGSTGDQGAMTWLLKDPRCHVSYNWLVLDNGAIVQIAPGGSRAWHAGVCQPSSSRYAYRDANSAFYGVSLAATVGDTATEAAVHCVATQCLKLFRHHGWDPEREGWRIVGHETEAWPRGRKIDPTGPDPGNPVMAVQDIRTRVAALARETTV